MDKGSLAGYSPLGCKDSDMTECLILSLMPYQAPTSSYPEDRGLGSAFCRFRPWLGI